MHREHRQWHSPALGRTMELLVFGHAGTPLITFPSSMGRFYEWEDFGMIEALRVLKACRKTAVAARRDAP